MSRCKKDPLCDLTSEERIVLEQIGRSYNEPAIQVARSKIILAVAEGQDYTQAAHTAGRKSGDAVSKLVSRFKQEGIAALVPRRSGGKQPTYTAVEKERILREARRILDPEQDGAAVWSLSILQRALRQAAGGLPKVSTYTIWLVLREAGWRWQQDRTWCETGQVKRKRKEGVVEVQDPDATPKKVDRERLQGSRFPGTGATDN